MNVAVVEAPYVQVSNIAGVRRDGGTEESESHVPLLNV